MVKDREILRKILAFFVPAAVAATVQVEKHYVCKRLGYYDVFLVGRWPNHAVVSLSFEPGVCLVSLSPQNGLE